MKESINLQNEIFIAVLNDSPREVDDVALIQLRYSAIAASPVSKSGASGQTTAVLLALLKQMIRNWLKNVIITNNTKHTIRMSYTLASRSSNSANVEFRSIESKEEGKVDVARDFTGVYINITNKSNIYEFWGEIDHLVKTGEKHIVEGDPTYNFIKVNNKLDRTVRVTYKLVPLEKSSQKEIPETTVALARQTEKQFPISPWYNGAHVTVQAAENPNMIWVTGRRVQNGETYDIQGDSFNTSNTAGDVVANSGTYTNNTFDRSNFTIGNGNQANTGTTRSGMENPK